MKKRRNKLAFSSVLFILVILCLSIFGCGGGSGGGGGGDTPIPSPSPTSTTGGTVTGKVLDVDGSPLASATVGYSLAGSDSLTRDSITTTDSNGNYTLTDVPAGNQLITAYKGNYSRTSEVNVISGGTVTLELQVTPSGAITGKVYDENTQGIISSAKVSLTIPDQKFVMETYTDSTGVYMLNFIPTGTYLVSAAKSGYNLTSGSIDVTQGNASTLNLYMEPSSSPTPTPTPTSSPNPNNWMSYTNYYRGMSNVQSLTENTSWSDDCYKHAYYIVKTDELAHEEDSSSPYYTPEGETAAQSSNLAASYDINDGVKFSIETWMQAPFHAIAMIDPALRTSGYGIYHEEDGGLVMGAAIDVVRGRTTPPSDTQFPIMWPGDGTTVNLRLHWGETPDPLTSCPGYTAPVGLPVTLQLGSGSITPNVTAHSFKKSDGTSLEHCVFDETNYSNPSDYEQDWIRYILNQRDAIVLIPKEPLTPGETYLVSITTNGETYNWSFTVSTDAADQKIGRRKPVLIPGL